MTVSASATLDFTRDQLIRMAYQLAGLLEAGREPSAADVGMAADFMNLELMSLQAENVVLRTVDRTALPLTLALGASYTLDADTIDVQVSANDQAGVILGASGNPTPLTVVSRDQYLNLPTDTTGRPTRLLVEKGSRVTAVFWPAPDGDYTWRYAKVRLLRDVDEGSVTLDVARRWLQAVAYAVATKIALAKSLAMERVAALHSEAERLKSICRNDDTNAGKIRFVIRHQRAW